MEASSWARERFGSVADELQSCVFRALHRAHMYAMTAHVDADMDTHDTYGATMRVKQFTELVTATADLPGVVARKPANIRERFEFVVVDDVKVALYPWRFGRDAGSTHLTARFALPLSDSRKNLLTLTPRIEEHQQLNIDQAHLTPEELAAAAAEEATFYEQMKRFGRVVTVAYASHPDKGVFGLAWGDAVLDPDRGQMEWEYHEPLVLLGGAPGMPGDGDGNISPVKPRPLHTVGGDAAVRPPRFDDAPLDDDFGDLSPRVPLEGAPVSEPAPPPAKTSGNEDDGGKL